MSLLRVAEKITTSPRLNSHGLWFRILKALKRFRVQGLGKSLALGLASSGFAKVLYCFRHGSRKLYRVSIIGRFQRFH